MKPLLTLIGTAGLAVMLCAGCKKAESPTSDASDAPAAPEPKPEAISMEQIEETVTETAETAKKMISDTSAKAQELLTQAQKLVGDQKYEEAGNVLQKLADFQLTPEQQKMLDDLKATLQKAMESEAVKQGTKALGNMLGGEK